MKKIHPKLSIVIVSYNVSQLTINCIHSIFKYERSVPFEVFVVDNNSTDSTIENLITEFGNNKNVKLIANKENLGYAGGNNQVIDEVEG